MHRAVRKIRETLSHIDLVLEVRDARLPISTINPAFEKLFGSDRGLLPKNGKKRIIIYNKRDLAEPGLERVRR
jgi:ribosome biogenesis GTPase A